MGLAQVPSEETFYTIHYPLPTTHYQQFMTPEYNETWDAGEMGCGELVMILRVRMNNIPARGVLKLIALDAGAKEDIPAWCRMTGHTLIHEDHPTYFIRRRES